MPSAYKPINCSFYDILETIATQKREVEICIRTEAGMEIYHSSIVNLVTRSGEEFMILDNGEHIKLDRIIRVDGNSLHDFNGHCSI